MKKFIIVFVLVGILTLTATASAQTQTATNLQTLIAQLQAQIAVLVAQLSQLQGNVPNIQRPTATTTPVIAYLSGVQKTYRAGQKIALSLKSLEWDSSPATPGEGFNVQAYIYDSGRTRTFAGANGNFSSSTGLWDVSLTAPTSTAPAYDLETFLYCSRDNSTCRKLYGQFQTSKVSRFTVLDPSRPTPTTTPTTTPTITVLSPNGGETWLRGTTKTIVWTSSGAINYVNIELFKASSSLGRIVTSANNNGFYDWRIPATSTIASDYKIRISDYYRTNALVNDYSNNNFSLVGATTTATTTTTISPYPSITTTYLPTATVGTTYSATIAATGGENPYIWSLDSSPLPPGLIFIKPICLTSLTSPCQEPAIIKGIPTRSGMYIFSVTVNSGSPIYGDRMVTGHFYIFVNSNGSSSSGSSSSGGYTNKPPTVISVGGSTILSVGQVGDWSVSASDPEGGPLTFKVLWTGSGTSTPSSSTTSFYNQIYTFNFKQSFSTAGIKTAFISVTDDKNQSVSTSAETSVIEADTETTVASSKGATLAAVAASLQELLNQLGRFLRGR